MHRLETILNGFWKDSRSKRQFQNQMSAKLYVVFVSLASLKIKFYNQRKLILKKIKDCSKKVLQKFVFQIWYSKFEGPSV